MLVKSEQTFSKQYVNGRESRLVVTLREFTDKTMLATFSTEGGVSVRIPVGMPVFQTPAEDTIAMLAKAWVDGLSLSDVLKHALAVAEPWGDAWAADADRRAGREEQAPAPGGDDHEA